MFLQGFPLRFGTASGPLTLEPKGPSTRAPSGGIGAFRALGPRAPQLEESWGLRGIVVESVDLVGRPPLRSGPPAVAGIDLDLLRQGEAVSIDGRVGQVSIPMAVEVPAVTVFLERGDGRILLLRRSERVGSFRGRWAGVSGFLEDPTADAQARREVLEETGVDLGRTDPVARGRVVYARDRRKIYAIHPFRYRVDDPPVTLDWEHTAFAWVEPRQIHRRAVVPKLAKVWRSVQGLPSGPPPVPKETL